MQSYHWIKLYHEILHDPKMGRLPDRAWRRAIEMFLLAGENGRDGTLPPISDIAWKLRTAEAELVAELETLEEFGIIQQEDAETWIVTNFEDRQAPMDDAERKRRQRERDRKQEYYSHESVTEDVTEPVTDDVTIRDTDKNRIDKMREEKIQESGEDAGPDGPSTFADWQSLIEPENSNRPAILRDMHLSLYPGRDPPSFGYIGKVARKVGGAGRLAELLWQNSTRPPTGDVLAYVQGVAKRGKHGTDSDGRISIQGHHPTAATPEEFYGPDG